MSGLAPKRQRFVDEYLIDLNARKAAIRAGYSENRAGRQGNRLLRYPQVAKAVLAGQRALAQRAHVSDATVLEKLAELRDNAAQKGQYSVALKAEELRGKHIGMFADRKPGQVRRLDEMSEEEIVESLGLAKKEIDRALSKQGQTKAQGAKKQSK